VTARKGGVKAGLSWPGRIFSRIISPLPLERVIHRAGDSTGADRPLTGQFQHILRQDIPLDLV
jgi:hypothetical protein